MEAAVEGALLIGLHVQELGRIATNIITARLLGTTNTNNAQVIFVTPPCAPNVRDLIMYSKADDQIIPISLSQATPSSSSYFTAWTRKTHMSGISACWAPDSHLCDQDPASTLPMIPGYYQQLVAPMLAPGYAIECGTRSRAIPHKITRQIGRPLRLCGLLS